MGSRKFCWSRNREWSKPIGQPCPAENSEQPPFVDVRTRMSDLCVIFNWIPKKKSPAVCWALIHITVYLVSLPGVAVNSFGLAIGLTARAARLGALAAAP